MNSKERENLLENERTMIASKLAELSEEQSKKMLQKEIRLREDAQSKFVLLEKVCKPMFSTIPHKEEGHWSRNVSRNNYCFLDHYWECNACQHYANFFPVPSWYLTGKSDKCVIKFQYSGHTLVSPMEGNYFSFTCKLIFLLENLNLDFPPLKTSNDHSQEDEKVVFTTQIRLNSSTIFKILSISHL